MATEEPKYTVLEKESPFEIRSYAPMIVAEVQVEGDLDEASSQGFRLTPVKNLNELWACRITLQLRHQTPRL